MTTKDKTTVGDCYISGQPHALFDAHCYGGQDAEQIVEGFVGAVWSGQIRGSRRLVR